jgi:hypothetical protein
MGGAALWLAACGPIKLQDDAARVDAAASDVVDDAPTFDAASNDAIADAPSFDAAHDAFALRDAMSDASDGRGAATDATLVSDVPSAGDAAEGGPVRPAGTCTTAPTIVAAGASMRVPFTMVAPSSRTGLPPSYLQCISGVSSDLANSWSARFTLSAPSQVTIFKTHDTRGGGIGFALATDCASPSQVCIQSALYPRMITRVLAAGTYEVQAFDTGQPWVLVEPPVPQPTNVTCATAIPTTSRVVTSIGPRVLDARSRFVRWRSGPDPVDNVLYVRVESQTSNGQAVLTLRQGCAAGAPEVLHFVVGYLVGLNMPGLMATVVPDTEYVLEVSDIAVGVTMDVTFSNSF